MRENRALKIISYITLPIFVAIIIMSFIYSVAKQENIYRLDVSYFETEEFAQEYMRRLGTITNELIYESGLPNNYDDKYRIFYTSNTSILKDYYFLVVYKDKAITNVYSKYNIEEIKQYINDKNGKQFISINGNIKSNSLNQNIDQYKHLLDHVYYNTSKTTEQVTTDKSSSTISTTPVYQTAKFEDYQIYTTYKAEYDLTGEEEFIVGILRLIQPYENILYISVPICAILTLMSIIYLVISIGHKKGKDEIDTNDFDKIPFEIILLIVWVIVIISLLIVKFIMSFYGSDVYYKLYLSAAICLYFVIYIVFMTAMTTFIKRIKANNLVQTSIIGKICTSIEKLLKNFKNSLNNMTISASNGAKLIISIAIYLTIMVIVFLILRNQIFLAILIDTLIMIYAIYQIIKRIKSFEMLEDGLKNIYQGNNNKKLDPNDFTKEFRNAVNYINDISNGFDNAIKEKIKSERLKTELITNVSHDIKTPLTSIINYVDLLKRENIKNDKAKEYIEILENKALRLKRLTEDLVEASKASSGNVKLKLEKIGITELLKQTTAEFEEKFQERKLEIITDFPKEEIYIRADSRYMYRIIENAFSNISKYALENSRVYIDVRTNENKVNVAIKNISSDKLNISEEELMQRFVRGDKSRTTDGSGLGLSIAKSLTELQTGKFNIRIDGDLFKFEIEFDKIQA